MTNDNKHKKLSDSSKRGNDFTAANKRLDEVDFFDLMQAYRHTPISEQDKAVERFEAVKEWIRRNYA